MLQLVDNASIVVDPQDHPLSLAQIPANVREVLGGLRRAGYDAFLVGGCVRDLLLGMQPKDFDIVTDALPEKIQRLFPGSRIIGRRFRLVHVHFGRHYLEVATYRGDHAKAQNRKDAVHRGGRIIRDNVYGNRSEDAQRRDFTINALYFNYLDECISDQTGGLDDLERKRIRLIGEPDLRYREDPVRLLRAVRFASKLGFTIDTATEQPLYELGHLLGEVPPARLFDEVLKLFLAGNAELSWRQLQKFGLDQALFPSLGKIPEPHQRFITMGLADTDRRVKEGKPVTPAYLFAVLFWESYRAKSGECLDRRTGLYEMRYAAANEVLRELSSQVTLPRRFSLQAQEIWVMQSRLCEQVGRKKSVRLLDHRQFRAAYDFLRLRSQWGETPSLDAALEWWQQVVEERESAAPPRKTSRRRRAKRGSHAPQR